MPVSAQSSFTSFCAMARFLSDIFANLSDASNVGASFFHPLESRRLLAADFPTPAEQYLVELINCARMDPSAEAARLGIALNEGLAAGTISTAAKQPLAINPNLTDAAGKHSQWMIDNDVFSHYE